MLPRMHSVRSKLVLAIGFAALLPLTLVAGLAIKLILDRFDRGMAQDAQKTARIATSLLLQNVQGLNSRAGEIAASEELQELLALQPALVDAYLSRRASLGAPLLEVIDRSGKTIARRTTSAKLYQGIRTDAKSKAAQHALDYERFMTLTEVSGHLAIRVSAPVVDARFNVLGAVVITRLIDGKLADHLKGVVRAEVSFFLTDRPIASTYHDETGNRIAGIRVPAATSRKVLSGKNAQWVTTIGDNDYSLALVPLQTVDEKPIGMLAIGLSRRGLAGVKLSAIRLLIFGVAFTVLLSVALAYFLGKRISTPLLRLQHHTQAVAAGDLNRTLEVETNDEIGQLALSFQTMTEALRDNQDRLAARIREISTVQQIGRAVTSVLSLDQVLRLVVSEIANILAAGKVALFLARDDEQLRVPSAVGFKLEKDGDAPEFAVPYSWRKLASDTLARRESTIEQHRISAPLRTHDRVVGILILARQEEDPPFTPAEIRLTLTVVDQAATAIDNAWLYAEVQAFSQELERKVEQRTAELQTANHELSSAMSQLKETHAQLVHSERMAGLGSLVAGVAHEINTPAGAIQGAAQVLDSTLRRGLKRMGALVSSDLSRDEVAGLFEELAQEQNLRTLPLDRPAGLRRQAKLISEALSQAGKDLEPPLIRRLLEARAGHLVERVADLSDRISPELLVGVMEDRAFLARGTHAIQLSIRSLVRLVGALKSYAHADRDTIEELDVTDGLETTLTILHNALQRGIILERRYAKLPRIPAFPDELNQVWTNLIHNAVQAMNHQGTIIVETFVDGSEIGVCIRDDGPGIPPEILPRIFEPYFTTKKRGVGTGLGLGIARKIIDKHGGQIEVESRPGGTEFRVLLPIDGPPSPPPAESAEEAWKKENT